MVLYPILIAPLFNKFSPLKEGRLRDEIMEMIKGTGFKVFNYYYSNFS
jgi:STE24 endopeptidase